MSSFSIINQINKDLSETKRSIDETNLVIFKTTDKVSRIRYKKKAVIVNEGDPFINVFFLAKGFIKVFRNVEDKIIFMRLLAPGDYIGINIFAKMKQYPYSLVSLDDSVVYVIHGDAFRDDIYKNPQVMKWVIKNLSYMTIDLWKKNVFLRCKHMNGRVADTILYFADEIFKSDTFHLPINSKQFAHYVNISPENVSRIMKAFSNEKILTFKNRNISIQDKERLIQISKIG